MKISAVLACHNEERFIAEWLDATSSYADEILIALHAPTDGTSRIVSDFQANSPIPTTCEWFPPITVLRFGFSVMKNEMIARASGDWITSIDADEEIGLPPDQLRAAIESAERDKKKCVALYWATLQEAALDAVGELQQDRAGARARHRIMKPAIRKWKIFRNHADIWWRGLIHEELFQQDRHLAASCLQLDAPLHHYAYLRGGEPEWKWPLYAWLACRGRRNPRLRWGTHDFWFTEAYERAAEEFEQAAEQFAEQQTRWFPPQSGSNCA